MCTVLEPRSLNSEEVKAVKEWSEIKVKIKLIVMDVGELLSFKPDIAPKRPNESGEGGGGLSDDDDVPSALVDDPNDSYEVRAAKRRKRAKLMEQKAAKKRKEAAAVAIEREESRVAAEEARAAAAAAAAAAGDEETVTGVLDDTALKRLILAFEKRSLKNQELRIKFPDDPQKFMASEVELHDAIQDLRVVATCPDLYPILVELRSVSSFVGLLNHENTDVVVAVIDLIQELTDVDTLHESEEGAEALIEALVHNQVAAQLVQCMDKLNEAVREESDGVHNALSIFENLVEFRPAVCSEAAEAGLVAWLVKKVKVKVPFDNNKLFASEILSILLQNEPENRKRFGEMGSSMDSLLQQLAYYKRHNPGTAEEAELMENLFDCLCSLLLHAPNRELFLRGEGLQLMNLMLREKKESRNGALKVLDHAVVGPEGKEQCAKVRLPQANFSLSSSFTLYIRLKTSFFSDLVHRYTRPPHDIPTLHEDSQEEQEEGSFCRGARRTRTFFRDTNTKDKKER